MNYFYIWCRFHQFEHPSGAPGSRGRQSIHGGRTETSVGGHARCHCRGNRWPWPFARSCFPRSCGTTGKSECCSPNSMSSIFFCLIDVYLICKITSKGHKIQLPGNFNVNVYIQYEIFFFKIGYTEHHLCFIWNIYTWTCIYIKKIFIINLSFISDICGWTSRMWKERVHQNVWIFWERAG